ncbi:MAG: histidine kinase [Sphingobacteriales bacterium]|nr:histidine kinase [Sphingobacteriales bacterium]
MKFNLKEEKVIDSEASLQADVESIKRIPVISNILEVICRSTGMGFAAIARVTENRWIACGVRDEIQFGLIPGEELKLQTTICDEIRQSGKAVIIDDVKSDSIYNQHSTPELYGFRSYISMPIYLTNGDFFGTLCAIDPKPAKINNPQTVGMFKLFAELIAFHLNALEQLSQSEKKLEEERKNAELRDQFIAILGHDLRNPLGAVSTSAQFLARTPLPERSLRLVNIIQDSSYRMTGLIENILDFARGRLGGGITLNRKPDYSLEEVLNQVITELHILWPDRTIVTEFSLNDYPVDCDSKRIAQLFSNLLSNALTYGNTDAPVTVNALYTTEEFILSITNSSTKIPPTVMDRMFKPFSRGEVKPGQQGLGLGLYIASEIARAHGGTLDMASTDQETKFTLVIPQRNSNLE